MPAKTKKFFVPKYIWNCFGTENPAIIQENLKLVSLRPPNGCCGFLAVYCSFDELQSFHPGADFIPLKTPVGYAIPAIVYRHRPTFPNQAFAFMLAYGTVEALRWQHPDGEWFYVELPWLEDSGATDNLSGLAPGSTPNAAGILPESSLDDLNHLPPRWRN